MIGRFFSAGEYDGPIAKEANLNSEGEADQFVTVFDADGEFEWARTIPGRGIESENIFGAEKLGGDYKPLGTGFNRGHSINFHHG